MATINSAIGTPGEGRELLEITNDFNAQTLTYNAVAGDRGTVIRYSGAGGVDLTFDAAATLGEGWYVTVRNDAAADITLNPNGGELIDGAATLALEPTQAITVYCSGTAFFTEGEYIQRLALSGGTMTGLLVLSADPVVALGAATKQYVDAIAAGIDIKTPAYAGTTVALNTVYANGAAGIGATLTNNGALAAFSVDGVSPALNARVLVKNQATTFENGIYTLTTVGSGAVAWVLTRATDYDEPAEITVGSLIIVQNGTVNAITSWLQTDTVVAVGVDPIQFTQFSAGVGANTALSNLAAVAINTSLVSDADITDDLGTPAIRWANIYAESVATGDTAADVLAVQGYDTLGTAYTDFITVTAGNPPTCALNGAITSVTQGAADNSTKLATTAYADAAAAAVAPTYPIALNLGGTNKNLTASNGGIVWSDADSMEILAGTATALQMLQSGSTATPAWSTATWPATTTINQMLYSSANNVVAGLATANSAVLVTTSAGVPVMTGTLTDGQIVIGSTGATPVAASLTAGAGITITPGAGSISIAASGSGDGLVFIATATAAAAATIDFSNNLSATYDNYWIVLENLLPATNATSLQLRVGTGAGPTYEATNYIDSLGNTTFITISVSANRTVVNLPNTAGRTTGWSMWISGANSATDKSIYATGASATASLQANISFGAWQSATVITSLRLFMSSGNINGTAKLYGLKN